MSYNNLIKLAKKEKEPSRNNRSLVLPASIALGSGAGLGYRHFAGKAGKLKDEIEDLKSSIPALDPRHRKDLEAANELLTKNKSALDELNANRSMFDYDKKLFGSAHEFVEPEVYKKDPKYYDDTENFFKRRRAELMSAKDELQERANKASAAMKAHDDTVSNIADKLDAIKKARGRALLKGKALGVVGVGLVGGGLIHSMSLPREKR